MISQVFLALSLVGAEWVMYFLIVLSVVSVAIMVERYRYYKRSSLNGEAFRGRARELGAAASWQELHELATGRLVTCPDDPDANLVRALVESRNDSALDSLEEAAADAMIRIRNRWDRHLVHLAIIGANAPFVGLFGTVLGIITAFHQLASAQAGGVGTVMSGIAEALVATAVGLFVAIPAVVAFNLLQRRVKSTMNEAEALKAFLIGRLIRKETGA